MNDKAKKKNGRGGARPGSGPKRRLEEGQYTPTYLDKPTREFMTELGEGNLSEGIRRAARMLSGSETIASPIVKIQIIEE